MAGHSKFKNIMFRKGAQDKKRSKLFTKLAKEITVSAKLGMPDPDHNPRLRSAISTARAQSMPKDNIQRAIDRASASDVQSFEEARYEGYGPGKVAIIVEALTDNKNRTAAEIRSIFNKMGGVFGESNSVSFNFERVGCIQFSIETEDEEKIIEIAIDSGAEDVEIDDEAYSIYCPPDKLHSVLGLLSDKLGDPIFSRLDWKPLAKVDVSSDKVEKLFNLISALNDNDDVQLISANYEIDDESLNSINL